MKKILLIMVAAVLAFSLALPQRTEARHGGGWWVPGAIFGGFLFGAAVARPWYPPPPAYYYPPPPVYAYPPPVYAYPPPQVYPPPQSYSYPAPNTAPPPRAEAPRSEAPPSSAGEWVTVPGQYVGDRWVPSHRAWVPTP